MRIWNFIYCWQRLRQIMNFKNIEGKNAYWCHSTSSTHEGCSQQREFAGRVDQFHLYEKADPPFKPSQIIVVKNLRLTCAQPKHTQVNDHEFGQGNDTETSKVDTNSTYLFSYLRPGLTARQRNHPASHPQNSYRNFQIFYCDDLRLTSFHLKCINPKFSRCIMSLLSPKFIRIQLSQISLCVNFCSPTTIIPDTRIPEFKEV